MSWTLAHIYGHAHLSHCLKYRQRTWQRCRGLQRVRGHCWVFHYSVMREHLLKVLYNCPSWWDKKAPDSCCPALSFCLWGRIHAVVSQCPASASNLESSVINLRCMVPIEASASWSFNIFYIWVCPIRKKSYEGIILHAAENKWNRYWYIILLQIVMNWLVISSLFLSKKTNSLPAYIIWFTQEKKKAILFARMKEIVETCTHLLHTIYLRRGFCFKILLVSKLGIHKLCSAF